MALGQSGNEKGIGARSSALESLKGINYLLAIGIDRYNNLPRLYNCVKDVEDIVAILTEKYQFEEHYITALFNEEATRPNLHYTLRKAAEKIGSNDNFLIYFSGHGHYDKILEQGYWIPVEAKQNAYDQYIPNSEIRAFLSAIKSRHTFLMVDSCFSGALFAKGITKEVSKRYESDPSRWGLTSGRNEIVSDGKPGDNSPFAESLLYRLRQNTDSLTVQELCAHIVEHVSTKTDQTPIGEPLKVKGHKNGQFVFHLRKDENRDWAGALEQGNLVAFQSFLRMYPEGQYIDKAAWHIAKIENTEYAYLKYFLEHPSGAYREEAQRMREELEEKRIWEQIRHYQTASPYEKYINRYPQGIYTDKAKEVLNRIRNKENDFWTDVKGKDSIAAYQNYLAAYPKGRYVKEAIQAKRGLEQHLEKTASPLEEGADFEIPEIPSHYGFPEEPYRFLESYGKQDARVFFGREYYIRDLYRRVNNPLAAPLISLYGQAGVGKSSFLEAGLLPRLESDYETRLLRLEPFKGLAASLTALLGLSSSETNAVALGRRWRQLEAESEKKGLIVILDQVERDGGEPLGSADDLASFLQIIAEIFQNFDAKPNGKIILSYRKEYDFDVDKACLEINLPRERIFLDKLNRQDTIEIVNGLTSSRQLRDKYRLSVEEKLPELIADDLLIDKRSSVALRLNFLLFELWRRQQGVENKEFSINSYRRLLKEGSFLTDFFNERMKKLNDWENKIGFPVESSGLVLDILEYHAPDTGIAMSRSREELRGRYQHQSNVLEPLINKLQGLLLLRRMDVDRTILVHDALVPIVRQAFRDSDKPGQRAFRILNQQREVYLNSPENSYMDEYDLMMVEQGALGMRKWTEEEQWLVRISRERRKEIQSERRINRWIRKGAVIIMLISMLIMWALCWQSHRKNKIFKPTYESFNLEKTNATKAFNLANQALI